MSRRKDSCIAPSCLSWATVAVSRASGFLRFDVGARLIDKAAWPEWLC